MRWQVFIGIFLALFFIRCGILQEERSYAMWPKPCDSTLSFYEKERHFFQRDFLSKEGILDQRKWWFYASRPENAPCVRDIENKQDQF